ncbi:DUF6168 family protein [Polaribacter sp. L3A8]|uniref:DUF6168 family protein n=1 Tax=Polaribacter sp. L3A8 TaxID=2686361 RepID=UPI00131EA496|nr:DUF6168 family protein [Polaribacter sp. L3A8]
MNKSIITILLTFITLYIVGTYTHKTILVNQDITLPLSIEKLYLFLAGFSILTCVNLLLLSTLPKISEQLGFIYLGMLMLKIILFSTVFYHPIIKQENLILTTKISLIAPIFVFLFLEVIFVVKILNNNR